MHYKTCEMCGIKSGRLNNEKRIFMAKFPMDEERCKKWVKATGKEDLVNVPIEKLHDLKYVCGKHFVPEDYTNFYTKYTTQLRLTTAAVPSLELPSNPLPDEMLNGFPKHIEKKKKPIPVKNDSRAQVPVLIFSDKGAVITQKPGLPISVLSKLNIVKPTEQQPTLQVEQQPTPKFDQVPPPKITVKKLQKKEQRKKEDVPDYESMSPDMLIKEIKNLREEQRNNLQTIKELQKKLSIARYNNTASYIQIKNMPVFEPETKEILIDMFIDTAKVLGVNMQPDKIRNIFRFKSDDLDNIVVVNFTSVLLKKMIVRNYKKYTQDKGSLTTDDITISGAVPTQIKKFFTYANDFTKCTKENKSYYVSNGKVFLCKQEGDVFKIKNEPDSNVVTI